MKNKKLFVIKLVTILAGAAAVISGVILAIYARLPVILTHSNNKDAASIGIIGGADGPTAIFVAGSVITPTLPILFAIISCIGAVLWVVVRKKSK